MGARVGSDNGAAGNGDGAESSRRLVGRTPLRLSILVVEDHPTTSVAMKKLLGSMGHRVTTAASAAEAEAAWLADQFDLLISDLGLPDASGHDLIGRLRRHRPVRGIAVSGFGMADDVRRSGESGFFAHVTKPLDVRRLEETIVAAMAEAPVDGDGIGRA